MDKHKWIIQTEKRKWKKKENGTRERERSPRVRASSESSTSRRDEAHAIHTDRRHEQVPGKLLSQEPNDLDFNTRAVIGSGEAESSATPGESYLGGMNHSRILSQLSPDSSESHPLHPTQP